MTGHELALSTIGSPASVSIRLNPFKLRLPDGASLKDEVERMMGVAAEEVPWCGWGFTLDKRPIFTLDPLFHAGVYYVQDSSAMFAGKLARDIIPLARTAGRPLRVLDLCAAPGGKTTDLAASLRFLCPEGFELVSNEVMRQRASVLKDNVSVWGDPDVTVTSCDPAAFARLGGWFDIILADVPCSGEGMFRKDSRAVSEWSEDVVKLCAERQRRIISSVWPALREGGFLIYSTCTFEESENDLNLEWTAEELGGEILTGTGREAFFGDVPACIRRTASGYLLVPGEVPGEGQWAGVLRKTSSARPCPRNSGIQLLSPLRERSRSVLTEGDRKKGDLWIPDPDSALSIDFDRTAYPMVEADRATALKYLHRDSISLTGAPLGYNVICFEGHPLGFVKNLGSRCNSLLPKWRRILMNIE